MSQKDLHTFGSVHCCGIKERCEGIDTNIQKFGLGGH